MSMQIRKVNLPYASSRGGIHDFLHVHGLGDEDKCSQGKIFVKEDSIISTKDDFMCVVPLLEQGIRARNS